MVIPGLCQHFFVIKITKDKQVIRLSYLLLSRKHLVNIHADIKHRIVTSYSQESHTLPSELMIQEIQSPAQITPPCYYQIISVQFCHMAPSHSSTPYDILGEGFKSKLKLLHPYGPPTNCTHEGVTSAGPCAGLGCRGNLSDRRHLTLLLPYKAPIKPL